MLNLHTSNYFIYSTGILYLYNYCFHLMYSAHAHTTHPQGWLSSSSVAPCLFWLLVVDEDMMN